MSEVSLLNTMTCCSFFVLPLEMETPTHQTPSSVTIMTKMNGLIRSHFITVTIYFCPYLRPEESRWIRGPPGSRFLILRYRSTQPHIEIYKLFINVTNLPFLNSVSSLTPVKLKKKKKKSYSRVQWQIHGIQVIDNYYCFVIVKKCTVTESNIVFRRSVWWYWWYW